MTDRQQAEEALRHERDRALRYLDMVETIIVALDREGKITTINRKGCQLFGCGEDELIGQLWFTTCLPQPDGMEIVHPVFLNLMAGEIEGAEYFENPIVTRSGKLRQIAWHNALLRDAQGRIVSTLSSGEDITERKRAEEALRESEEKYRLLAETSSDYIFTVDRDLVVKYVNTSGAERWGLSTAEITGRNMKDLFPAEISARQSNVIRKIFETGKSIHSESLSEFPKSGPQWLDSWLVPIKGKDGTTESVMGISRNVTERKRAEEALRLKNFVFDASIAANSIADLDGVITEVNDAFLRIWGYPSKDEIVGKPIPYFFNDPDQALAIITVLSKTGRWEGDFTAKRKDGSTFIASFQATVLRDQNDEVIGYQSAIIDITDRKRMEEERIEMERRLLHGQKLESLGVLAGGIAHDFNNLLAAIIGNLSMVADDLPELSENHQAIEQAMLAAKRAADLTKQMLAYSGRGHIMVQKLDLNLLVQENVQMLRAVVPKTITLDLQLSRDMQMILVDASQVQQVVMNLLTNASDAIGEQAGSITLLTGVDYCSKAYLSRSRTENKPEAGMFVWIEVRDTGCGMDEETQKRLFEPFFTTKFTGRGLGMSAVLGIVQGHGGALVVDSKVGTGTSLRVLFPATLKQQDNGNQARAAIPAAKSEAERARPSGTVLVVDDEEMVRVLCNASLRRLGYQALQAVDGEEAIRVLKAHASEISAVILDLTMPMMDGVTAFKNMLQIKSDLKVILSSGYSEQDAIKNFPEHHPAGFLQKPYQLQELKAELEKVLNPGETTRTSVG